MDGENVVRFHDVRVGKQRDRDDTEWMKQEAAREALLSVMNTSGRTAEETVFDAIMALGEYSVMKLSPDVARDHVEMAMVNWMDQEEWTEEMDATHGPLPSQ
jgi:hypothetical protein